MPVTMNHQAVEDAKNEMAGRLFHAGSFFVAQQKQRVSTPFVGYGPSKKNEYPHLRTAQGRSGVTMDAANPEEVRNNGMIVRIGQRTNSWYMVYLEQFLERLGFAKTAKDLKNLLIAIIQTPFSVEDLGGNP